MKKGKQSGVGEMRSEYDLRSITGGVRGKYARRSGSGANLVLLEPDVAEAFPTAAAVNEALRALMRASSFVRRPKRARGRPPSAPPPAARR